MGRQYGALLKTELNANCDGIIKGLQTLTDTTHEGIREFADAIYGT